MQKTDFPIELIIGEDCSTDSTRKIVLEYAEKYPDIIRPLLPESNLGMMKNFNKTMEAAKGKYIAICEGDDYWTGPFKLQKQVDFLEANRDYAICATYFSELNGDKLISPLISNMKYIYPTFDDIIYNNPFGTLTIMLRNKNKLVPNWLKTMPYGDWPLFASIAANSKSVILPLRRLS